MTITPLALHYLNAWNARAVVMDGMAHRDLLDKCRLDYSIASLGRIDALLDIIRITCEPKRDAFLGLPENRILLHFLAFYAGEVVGRALRSPPVWLDYRDAAALSPSYRDAFSFCFETSVCCRFPGSKALETEFFTPLHVIAARLLSPHSGRSIRASAGLRLPREFDAEPLADMPTPALVPGLTGEVFEPPPPASRCQYRPARPWQIDGNRLGHVLDNVERLLREGGIVWCATVQANAALFKPEYGIGACGDVIYDPSGRLPPGDLAGFARAVSALKGTQPADARLKAIADHLADETGTVFGLNVPITVCPQPLKLSSTYFDQFFLPDGMLTLPCYPILVCDQCPGAVLPLPWQLWPQTLIRSWRRESEARHGMRVDSRDWKQRCDEEAQRNLDWRAADPDTSNANKLYEEGLRYFHGRGVLQDCAMASSLWEISARLGNANSLYLLGKIHEQGLQVDADIAKAISYYTSAAEKGHVLAQLNLGKIYLRGGASGIREQDAKRWLQSAARQGNGEADRLLLMHFTERRQNCQELVQPVTLLPIGIRSTEASISLAASGHPKVKG